MFKSGTLLLAALALVVAACTPTADDTPTALKPPVNCLSPEDPQRTTHINVLKPHVDMYCGTHVDVAWEVVDPCGDFYADVQVVMDNDLNMENGVLFEDVLMTNARNATGCCYTLPAMTCAETCFIVSARDQSGPIKTVVFEAGPVNPLPPHYNPPEEWTEP